MTQTITTTEGMSIAVTKYQFHYLARQYNDAIRFNGKVNCTRIVHVQDIHNQPHRVDLRQNFKGKEI